MRVLSSVVMLVGFLTFITGCANFGKQMKAFMAGESVTESNSERVRSAAKYSESQDVTYDDTGRQYRRMNRKQFEDNARVEEQAGSLWIMEGQGSYLFSQNMVRLVGDILNVRLDGEPKKQLETKADVIKKIIAKAARPPRAPAAQPGADTGVTQPKPGEPNDPNKKAEAKPDAPATAQKSEEDANKEKDEEGALAVHMVPSRISEKLPDGSYRIRGSQIFMIGKNEYKVIVTGIVRSSDVTDEGIDSSKILDGRFDIVSLKKEIRL